MRSAKKKRSPSQGKAKPKGKSPGMAGRGRRGGKGRAGKRGAKTAKSPTAPRTADEFRELGKKPRKGPLEETTKARALARIGIRLDHIITAQLRAVEDVDAAIEEAAPPRDDKIGFEKFMDVALDLVFFATTGFIGARVAAAVEQGFGASKTTGAVGKEVAKNIYKNSVAAIRSGKEPTRPAPVGGAGSNPARSPKARFIGLQKKALDDIRERQRLELNHIGDSLLDSYELATLNAVGTELIGVKDQAWEVHAREAVRQWLNFKARWFNQPVGRQRDADAPVAEQGDVTLRKRDFEGEILEGMIECEWAWDAKKMTLIKPRLIARGIEPSLVAYLKNSNGTLGSLRINRWYTVRGHQQGPGQYIRVLQGASGKLTNHVVNRDASVLLSKLGGFEALVDDASELSLGVLK